jgi:multicomponent Na+:H+ antiporter subunit G
MTLSEYLILLFAILGVIFNCISAIGVLRLPDVYTRMHAAGKASTLGVAFLLLAAGLHFGGSALVRMIAVMVLFYATAPIAVTTLARAAYRSGLVDDSSWRFNDLAAADPRRKHGAAR